MTGTMRAVVLDAPGPPSALVIRELPIPVPLVGWVLIRVKAFGLNRLELYLRLGLSEGVTFPRVPDAVAAGTAAVPIGRVYRFDQIVEAHTDMEQNRVSGKLVVTTSDGRSE